MSTNPNLSSAQFSAQHPHLNHYRDGGMGGIGEDHSVVGYVPTHLLANMHGNDTTPSRVDYQREQLRSGQGFTDPVMVEYDNSTHKAFLGEGNHRVEAAMREGVTHVPTRVVRSRIDDFTEKVVKRQGGTVAHVDPGENPFDRNGYNYWPSDVHPKYLWPHEDIR